MLTPSTPTRAIWKTASSAHSADTNALLTPGAPPHETEFISSIRSGTAVGGATPDERPDAVREPLRADRREDVRDRRVLRRRGGHEAQLERIPVQRRHAHRRLGGEGTGASSGIHFGAPVAGPASGTSRATIGDPREVAQVVREVVARAAAGDVPAARDSGRRRSSRTARARCRARAPRSSSEPTPSTSARASAAASAELSSSRLIAEDQMGADRMSQRGGHRDPVAARSSTGSRAACAPPASATTSSRSCRHRSAGSAPARG